MVRVRDENGIDRDRVENRCLRATPDRPDPALQEGIEQQPDPGYLEEDGRVTEPGQAGHI